MRCDDAQPLISAQADGAMPDGVGLDGVTPDGAAPDREADVRAHLVGCAPCRAFAAGIEQLRRELRYEVVDAPPDLATAVRRRLEADPRRGDPRAGDHSEDPRRRLHWTSAAAVFLAAVLAGALMVSGPVRGPSPVVAAELPARVLAAQAHLHALRADVEVVERGWHAEVSTRRYDGELTYRAPEDLRLELRDGTAYPAGSWTPNDVTVSATAERWEGTGPVPCPPGTQPACGDAPARREVVTSREPFGDGEPIVLDLVLPAGSFLRGGTPTLLGERQVAGRPAVGVQVTAAQMAPLLDGLRSVGDWRELHPTDQVELWLDAELYVPLSLTVRPAQDEERQLWAARRRYDDPPQRPILELRLHDLQVNTDIPDEAFATADQADAAAATRDVGFVEGPAADVPVPGWLPAGMRPHRSGTIATPKGPGVDVRTWTDGRAWVKVRATRAWPGGRLFGDLGDAVHVIDLDPAGMGYTDDLGERIAIHAGDLDLVVVGSVPMEQLRRIAASLDVAGRAVPSSWPEAHAVTVEQARAAMPDLLLPTGDGVAGSVPALAALADRGPEGFGPPGISIRDGIATTVYAGAGARGFVLTQAPGAALAPPLDPDVVGVEVRGHPARYAPARGELEWLEDGALMSLRSRTVGLTELIGIAESMTAP